MHEAGGRKPRGFGFVTFADASAVHKVLQSRFHPVDGRGVEVKLAIPRELMHDQGSNEAEGGVAYDGSAWAGGEQQFVGGEPYPSVPYGEYLSEQSDYPTMGYMPHYVGPYGYMPQLPMGAQMGGALPPMMPPGAMAHAATPAQGVRVLHGTEYYAIAKADFLPAGLPLAEPFSPGGTVIPAPMLAPTLPGAVLGGAPPSVPSP
eukprot:6056472-Prymnesium_polylepis.1